MASLQVQLIDIAREPVATDPTTHALYVTDTNSGGAGGSWAINQGISFAHSIELNLAANGRYTLRFVVDETVHLTIRGNSQAAMRWAIYETPTFSANGTAQVGVNRDRSSANVATLIPHNGATLTGGDALWQGLSGIGVQIEQELVQKFVLPAGTYAVYLIEASGTAQRFSIGLDWFEPHFIA